MKSSTNKIPLGQIDDIVRVVTKEDFVILSNYNQGSIYAVEGTDSGFLAISDAEVKRIWGEWEYTPFTLKINASDSTFTIPTHPSSTYNYAVDWGDGNYITGYTGNASHTYDSPGEYVVRIYGKFERIWFQNDGDKDKVIDLQKWGDISWKASLGSFFGCSNMILTATDIPDLTNVISLFMLFRSCSSITDLDVTQWDFSTITSTSLMVSGCLSLENFYADGIDTSNITNMASMFYNSPQLSDLPIQNWNVENVSNFSNFATGVTIPTATYDQILTNWSAQNVNPSLNIHFGNSQYSAAGQAGRDVLTNTYGWTITDDGPI